MNREQFLAGRRVGLGGSDASAAVGLCPWKSPYRLYVEKAEGYVDEIENESLTWGTLLEPVIRQRYCDMTGNEVTVFQSQLAHPDHPWMIANLDGRVSEKKIFEAKTYWTTDGWGPDGSDEVPEHYNLQVQHYMAVTGAESCDVAVLISGNQFRILTVYADKNIQSLLIDRESEFWHDHVLKKNPPEVTSGDDVAIRFKRSLGNMAVADNGTFTAWQQLCEVRKRIKTDEEIEERLKTAIKLKIGDRDGIEHDGKILATWKSAKDSLSFEKGRFESEHPELFRQYLRVVDGSRRFLVKEPK